MMNTMRRYRRGITMAETIVSTLLIGFVLVSTLQIVGPIVRSTSVHADALVAGNLANELTEEISTKLFTDPDEDAPDALGANTGERPAVKPDFDDIDDYDGWSASPPKLSNNQANVYLNGWTRSVRVTHVKLSDPETTSPTSTGLKRVVVSVSRNGVVLSSVSSLHSRSADALGFVVSAGG